MRCLVVAGPWGVLMKLRVPSGRRAARALLFVGATAVSAPPGAQTLAQLQDISIEELARIQVTTVSRRSETLSEAPAAIYVIGNEDIVRSSDRKSTRLNSSH